MYEDIKKSNKKAVIILLLTFISVGVFLLVQFVNQAISESPEQTEQRIATERAEREERISAERNEFFMSLTREQILEDFDYMMDILEENYPYFDLVYRVRNVDMREYAGRLRERLADETLELDLNIFLQMMQNEFFAHSRNAGHLQIINRSYYVNRLANALEEGNFHIDFRRWADFLYDVFVSHPATAFYGEVDEDDLSMALERSMIVPGNITTDIIEEGKIGYIRVNRMLRSVQGFDIVELRPFYNQLAGYEHLIIDIRDNPGGNAWGFQQAITAAHIENPLNIMGMNFIRGGDLNIRFMNAVHPGRRSNFEVIHDGQFIMGVGRSTLNFINANMNLNEILSIDYVVNHRETIFPSRPPNLQMTGFDGQIWLLINERTASAAEQIASLYKSQNLAILVGDTTRGIGGNPGLYPVYFMLPNSGAIVRYDIAYTIDSSGRALEEGIPPHILNRPGMDALETVLALIEEGAY